MGTTSASGWRGPGPGRADPRAIIGANYGLGASQGRRSRAAETPEREGPQGVESSCSSAAGGTGRWHCLTPGGEPVAGPAPSTPTHGVHGTPAPAALGAQSPLLMAPGTGLGQDLQSGLCKLPLRVRVPI